MKLLICLCLVLMSIQTYATHILGGYVQAKRVSPTSLQYDIVVTLYLDEVYGRAAADDVNIIQICFGDGTTRTITRATRQLVTDRVASLNVYQTQHTYAGPGSFVVTTTIPNRTEARNLPRADLLPFTLSTTLLINSQLVNQTPAVSVPATGFRLAARQRATINLQATDAEGDSLVYGLVRALTTTSLTSCEQRTATTYQFPNDATRQGTFRINSRTGTLVWDSPVELGRYVISIAIDEWRNGVTISRTIHEITVFVEDRPGTPTPTPPYEPAIEGAFGGIVTALPEYTDADIELVVFPNPVESRLWVTIQSRKAIVPSAQLRDIGGRLIHELRFNGPARRHEQLIDLESLSAGTYILHTEVNGRTITEKILKK